jgi:hypothetical protein
VWVSGGSVWCAMTLLPERRVPCDFFLVDPFNGRGPNRRVPIGVQSRKRKGASLFNHTQ